MNKIADMSEREIMEEIDNYPELTEATRAELEHDMTLYSYVRGWTGDPLCQPPQVVLAILRKIYLKNKRSKP